MKIDFCPNKQRLISLSFPLQLNSVDSRSPSGLRQALHPRPHNRASFNSRSPSGLRHLRICRSDTPIRVSIHAAQAGCDNMSVG